MFKKLLLLIPLLLSACNWPSLSIESHLTAKQALAYVCAHITDENMLETCKSIDVPGVSYDMQLGAYIGEDGQIHGVIGGFSPLTPNVIYFTPLMSSQPVWLQNAVLIHEMAHYIDFHDADSINLDHFGACDTEEKAHAVEHIYLIETGHWQEYMRDHGWRTWYDC